MPQQFDVFISRKSADAALSKELYLFLTAKGLSVFDANESLPEMGDADYQEAIDDALNSCTHMIVVGSKLEYLSSGWVKSEWRFFINAKHIGRKTGNILTVIAGDISVQNLPPILANYEVIQHNAANFERVYAYVKPKKLLQPPPPPPPKKKQPFSNLWVAFTALFIVAIIVAISIKQCGNGGGDDPGKGPATAEAPATTEGYVPAPAPADSAAAPATAEAAPATATVEPSEPSLKRRDPMPHRAVEEKTPEWTKHDERVMAVCTFSCSNIYFDYMSARLRPESAQTLTEVVDFLNQYPNLRVWVLSAHDSMEHIEDDQIIYRRSQSVADFIEKNGISGDRIVRRALPKHSPSAPSSIDGRDNPQGRQINRTTAIIIRTPGNKTIYHSALPGNMQQQIAKYGYH